MIWERPNSIPNIVRAVVSSNSNATSRRTENISNENFSNEGQTNNRERHIPGGKSMNWFPSLIILLIHAFVALHTMLKIL